MKFFLSFFCLVLANFPTFAAPTYEEREAQLKEWYAKTLPSLSQLPEGPVIVINQPYVETVTRGISPDSSQLLDLFVPHGNGPFPVIVNIHGGGWHAGGKESGT